MFWTQPTSGTVFFHTVLPESVLAKGRLTGTTSWKGMITGQTTYPRMSRPEQAYVQIDQVGQFTAAAGCAIYDGGAWPEKWRYSYFTGEPTLNIVHHEFVKPDGVSYTTAKEQGREQTEFMRSGDMWFRPIETRVGPDGALYIVDFYNQAVIHNDTRGPQHGPANAAVRPDRDHYFGRIWRVQHKQATRLDHAGAESRGSPRADPGDRDEPERPGQTDRLAAGAGELPVRPAPRADQEADGEQRARNLRAGTRRQRPPPQRKTLLDTFVQATDNWTPSAIAAAATEQPSLYVASAFAYERPQPLAEFVALVAPAALPASAGQLLVSAAAAGPQASASRPPPCGPWPGWKADRSPWTPRRRLPCRSCSTTPPRRQPRFRSWRSGTSPVCSPRAPSGKALALQREFDNPKTSDDRRAELAASLLAVPKARPSALATIAPMLADAAVSDALKARIITTLGESAGSDVDAMMIATLARTNSTPIFDQILRRPDATLALLAAMKDGKITPANLGPANVARLRTHPNRQVARQAASLLDTLSPAGKAKNEIIAALTPEIEKPGDAEKGKVLFTGTCSTCHKLGRAREEPKSGRR